MRNNGPSSSKERAAIWVFAVISLLVLLPFAAWGQPPGPTEGVPKGSVDWVKGVISITREATVDPRRTFNDAHSVIVALETARLIAYRDLLVIIKGVEVTTESQVGPGEKIKRKSVSEAQGVLRRPVVRKESYEFSSEEKSVVAKVTVELRLRPGDPPSAFRGYGVVSPGASGEEEERKARLQATLMALSRLGIASAETAIRTKTVVSDSFVETDRIWAQTNSLLGAPSGPSFSFRQSAEVRMFLLSHHRTEHRFRGKSGREGVREMGYLRLAGKVSAAEPVIVESILKTLGVHVEKGMSTKEFKDGSKVVEVTLRSKPPSPEAKPEVPLAPDTPVAGAFTGLILDATGLGAAPKLFPIIRDREGKIVYGPQLVNREIALNIGPVEFKASIPEAKESKERIGANPLVVKAIGVTGERKDDYVVSDDDAKQILEANLKGKDFLRSCRVVVVLK